MKSVDVVIVGGGLAGICCARELHRRGISFLLLERSDDFGGRVRTDTVDGFRLDRGFQVLLTAYPEARRELDYDALELVPYYPGSLIFFGGRMYRVADPWRRPIDALRSVTSPIGTLRDKMCVAAFRRRVRRGDVEALFDKPETTALEALRKQGFSDLMIERFFRPFFGGVFLDPMLETSSRMLDFVFRMFATGDSAVPVGGMGAIARQLTATLPDGSLRTGVEVTAVRADGVTLRSGDEIPARAVVVATDGLRAKNWVPDAVSESRAVTCMYFAATEPPVDEPVLVLDGDGDGPVNNLSVPSRLDPSLAPPGQSLISATVLSHPERRPAPRSEEDLELAVRAQLRGWFGGGVDAWRRLAVYHIAHAQPKISEARWSREPRTENGLYTCGDHLSNASIQAAMLSGRLAGEAVAGDLS